MTEPDLSADPELSLIRPFLPAEHRAAPLLMYQLADALREGVFSVSELPLARAKLAWWESELGRILEGSPDHPISRALAEHGAADRLDAAELAELPEGLLMRLDGRLYNDMDEVLLHAWRNEGALAVCAARLAGATRPETLNAARDFGLARELGRIIRDFEEERRAGRLWIPADHLAETGFRSEELLRTAPDAETRRRLLAPILDAARQRLAGTMTACPDRSTLRAPALLAALSRRSAEKTLRQGRRAEPGPLARLFTVWRAARRETGRDAPVEPG